MSFKTTALKIVPIGNSRGVRLPRAVLAKYRFGDEAILEERSEGVLLRGSTDTRLSWAETYAEMAREGEDWSVFAASVGDGLGKLVW